MPEEDLSLLSDVLGTKLQTGITAPIKMSLTIQRETSIGSVHSVTIVGTLETIHCTKKFLELTNGRLTIQRHGRLKPKF
jgi:hypothetical protein